MPHYTYILECNDHTLYIGYTNNLEKRVTDHNTSKRGARYTKPRRPVQLRYFEAYKTLSEALKREAALKKWTRGQKLALISQKRLRQPPKPKKSTAIDKNPGPC